MNPKSIGSLRETGPQRQAITVGAHGAQVGGGSLPTPQAKLTTTGVKIGSVGKPIETRKGC